MDPFSVWVRGWFLLFSISWGWCWSSELCCRSWWGSWWRGVQGVSDDVYWCCLVRLSYWSLSSWWPWRFVAPRWVFLLMAVSGLFGRLVNFEFIFCISPLVINLHYQAYSLKTKIDKNERNGLLYNFGRNQYNLWCFIRFGYIHAFCSLLVWLEIKCTLWFAYTTRFYKFTERSRWVVQLSL